MNKICYTYYNHIPELSDQGKIIEICKKSWERFGWTFKVLSEKNAKNHSFYSEYKERVLQFPTVNNKKYEYHCYMRWLAMANIGGGLMIDYDVINNGFIDHEELHKSNGLFCFELHVPSVVFGSSDDFLHTAKAFFELGLNNIGSYNNIPHISDMLLLQTQKIPYRYNQLVRYYPEHEGVQLIHCNSTVCKKMKIDKYDAMVSMFEMKTPTPVFFHIPKCGGISMMNYFMRCYLELNDNQNNITTNKVYTIHIKDNNIEPITIIGNFWNKDLVSSSDFKEISPVVNKSTNTQYIDLIIDYNNLLQYITEIEIFCLIVEPEGFRNHQQYIDILLKNRHIKFTKNILLRDPISRHESFFYYLKDKGQWEKYFGHFDRQMTFSEYINQYLKNSDSWLITNLMDLSDSLDIGPSHYQECIEYLSTFDTIGSLENINTFTKQLATKHHFPYDIEPTKMNNNDISIQSIISDIDMTTLVSKTVFDKQLYNYFIKTND